nr:hypothetical protein [uncultured Flavobacterium sp.]
MEKEKPKRELTGTCDIRPLRTELNQFVEIVVLSKTDKGYKEYEEWAKVRYSQV